MVEAEATGLHLEKALPVPPERVFAAFVDAEQFRKWWGPAGYTAQELELEVAEERDYRITMKPPEGDVFHIRGRFLIVDAPRRLEYTFAYEEPDPDDQETAVELTFDRSDHGTLLLLDHGPFKTAARWQLHHDGWTEIFERLELFLRDP